MKKRLTGIILAVLLVASVGVLGACSDKEDAKGADKTIVVGASPAPHAGILKAAEKELEKEGYKLEVKEFQDYVQPNLALEEGEIDANFFQHVPYLEQFNDERDTHLVDAVKVHYEPLGIYQGKVSKLSDLKAGDKIGVPNDATNEARALLLLEQEGVIKLKDGAGLKATKQDIVENPNNVEIVELEAAVIPRSLDDLAFGVINGNYALSAKIDENKAVAFEGKDSEAAKTYVNIVAVREKDKDSDKTKALKKALHSDAVKKFIEKEYGKAVVASF